MKVKLIDLLLQYSNKGRMPKKIKYGDVIWEWNGSNYEDKTKVLDSNKRYLLGKHNFNILNNEVEIIEEKPIEFIEPLKPISLEEFKKMNPEERYHATIVEYDKIEELRSAVNYLLKKEDE